MPAVGTSLLGELGKRAKPPNSIPFVFALEIVSAGNLAVGHGELQKIRRRQLPRDDGRHQNDSHASAPGAARPD
jgi:hypothetical protein